MDRPQLSIPVMPPKQPSILPRSKARTRKGSEVNEGSTTCGAQESVCVRAEGACLPFSCPEAIDEDTLGPAQTTSTTIRKARASFSSFGHAVEDLRSFPKRLTSKRRKSVVSTSTELEEKQAELVNRIYMVDQDYQKGSTSIEEQTPHHCVAPRWLRRCMSTTFRQHRRSPTTPAHPSATAWSHSDSPFPPIPGLTTVPPKIPDSFSSGAAARAAAAAQNEVQENFRRLWVSQSKVDRDSESGIGIEVRERPSEDEIPVVRQGGSSSQQMLGLVLMSF